MGLLAACLLGACKKETRPPDFSTVVDVDAPPRWHVDVVDHGQGDWVINDIWGDGTGVLYVVGQFGHIMSNRGADGLAADTWTSMVSPTSQHLTSIWGVANGLLFGFTDNQRGEIFAVGWDGTVLHFHPNPDLDPLTDDGLWSVISSKDTGYFASLLKVDPFCPDFDGDGVADDGDGSGWAGDSRCVGNPAASGAAPVAGCDDNCRSSANGPARPIADTAPPPAVAGDPPGNGCLSTADTADPDVLRRQQDTDGDGIGDICDGSPDQANPLSTGVDTPLYGVWARATGNALLVVVVGGRGAVLSYSGVSASVTPLPPMTLAVTDRAGWFAQTNVAYRWDTDCPQSTPAGTICAATPRLPAICPAQCSPARRDCLAAGRDDTLCTDGSQCCDSNPALFGAPCGDGTCGAVANACDGSNCFTYCPGCFRRLEHTLRGISETNGQLLAVGARGTAISVAVNDPTMTWTARSCVPLPYRDEPVFTATSGFGGAFHTVGQAGTLARMDPVAGGCFAEKRPGSPAAFLSDMFSVNNNSGFAVGDRGTLLRLNDTTVTEIETNTQKNLYAVWRRIARRTDGTNFNQVWLGGADGVLMTAAFF